MRKWFHDAYLSKEHLELKTYMNATRLAGFVESGRAQPHSKTWRNAQGPLKSAAASWSAALLRRFVR
jgi:hypothetical protein